MQINRKLEAELRSSDFWTMEQLRCDVLGDEHFAALTTIHTTCSAHPK